MVSRFHSDKLLKGFNDDNFHLPLIASVIQALDMNSNKHLEENMGYEEVGFHQSAQECGNNAKSIINKIWSTSFNNSDVIKYIPNQKNSGTHLMCKNDTGIARIYSKRSSSRKNKLPRNNYKQILVFGEEDFTIKNRMEKLGSYEFNYYLGFILNPLTSKAEEVFLRDTFSSDLIESLCYIYDIDYVRKYIQHNIDSSLDTISMRGIEYSAQQWLKNNNTVFYKSYGT